MLISIGGEQATVILGADQVTSPPFNAPNYAITPTPDGSGSVVHPSVLDFGGQWNGHRYWMGVTPFLGGNDSLENPCILVSSDGFTWTVPAGLTNPIDPTPTVGHNSDTDLTYDPDTDRLILIWRATADGASEGERWETVYASTSTNGYTWSAPATLIDLQNQAGNLSLLSPSLVRVGASDWRMFCKSGVRTASSPLGSWSGETAYTGSLSPGSLWHLDVNYTGGEFWMVANARDPWSLIAGVSANGVAWTFGTPFLQAEAASWDRDYPYRATMTEHPNGRDMQLWYSAVGPSSYRVGFTRVPRSLWAAL